MSAIARGPAPLPGLTAPNNVVSAPGSVEHHLILDAELSQLSRAETGIIGSFGFTALGAAIGLIPNMVTLWDKAPGPVTHSDIATGLAEAGSVVAAALCLAIYFYTAWRNRGLPTKIRNRPKHTLGPAVASLSP